MASESQVRLYINEFKVKYGRSDSMQAAVFFGHETSMGQRVVLKKYEGGTFNGIFREIKIFTYLENNRTKDSKL